MGPGWQRLRWAKGVRQRLLAHGAGPCGTGPARREKKMGGGEGKEVSGPSGSWASRPK